MINNNSSGIIHKDP